MPERARVFIVDDHPLVREWLANLLRQQPDLEVCGQADGVARALDLMAAEPPDVVIADLSLQAGGSGFDLIRDLRLRHPQTAVIVLSMHEEVYYAERALRAGARGYITKRESTGQIVAAIRQVRAGRIFAGPEVLARLAERLVGRAPSVPQSEVAALSNREIEVFRRLGEGHPTRRIAADLHVSIKTVQAYSARIKEKLNLASGAELVREAVRWVEGERARGGPGGDPERADGL
jgi:DNA-binding NarL/FixJ family response regulator